MIDSIHDVVAYDEAAARFAFNGRDVEPDTPMAYLDTRTCDPNTGQFMSSEPIGCEDDKPNAYRHIGTNSQDHVDPSGL